MRGTGKCGGRGRGSCPVRWCGDAFRPVALIIIFEENNFPVFPPRRDYCPYDAVHYEEHDNHREKVRVGRCYNHNGWPSPPRCETVREPCSSGDKGSAPHYRREARRANTAGNNHRLARRYNGVFGVGNRVPRRSAEEQGKGTAVWSGKSRRERVVCDRSGTAGDASWTI